MPNPTTAFLDAVKRGDAPAVERALAADPALIDLEPDAAPSAALLALYNGHPAVAQLLVERGAAVSVFEAAALGLTDVLAQLLEEEPAAVNALAADGFQPLGLACFFGQPETAALLLERGAEVNVASQNDANVMPLHSAVASRSADIVRLLLTRGADANARQAGGFRPLHGAAQNGDVQTIKLLLKAGADAAAVTDSGRTALDFAEGQEARTALTMR